MTPSRKDTPIPHCMAHLEKDKRGYPIPVNVVRDHNNEPHFTVNDERVADVLRRKGLCAITGRPMIDSYGRANMWFVGGVASAFHHRGAYFDSPMLKPAALYALKVCPYLAMPSYGRRIDGKTLDRAQAALDKAEMAVVVQDNTQIVERPPVFILAKAEGYQISYVPQPGHPTGVAHLHPKRPFASVEFWLNGEEISGERAWALTEEHLAAQDNPPFTMDDLLYWPADKMPKEARRRLIERGRALAVS